jgi:hypothetical protein
MTAQAVSDGTMPCPVPHPDGDADKPCSKKIPNGWTAGDGHGGGHMWMSAATKALLDSGHYDATAAIAGPPFSTHDPADCDYNCPRFWDNTPTASTPEEIR